MHLRVFLRICLDTGGPYIDSKYYDSYNGDPQKGTSDVGNAAYKAWG